MTALEESATVIGKASRLTLGAVALLLGAVSLTGVRMYDIASDFSQEMTERVLEINDRQTRMEERQIAAQILNSERLKVMSDDFRELSSALKEGLGNGTEKHREIDTRVQTLEKSVGELQYRVTRLEK